jgi:hypothetical protein
MSLKTKQNNFQVVIGQGSQPEEQKFTTTPSSPPPPPRGHSDELSDSWVGMRPPQTPRIPPPPPPHGGGGVAGTLGGSIPPRIRKFT